MNQRANKLKQGEKGSALLVSLVILIVMTLLGLQGMNSTLMEEKMSGNYRDNQLAFESAEAALRAGEAALNVFLSPPEATSNAANGIWTFTSIDSDDYLDSTWWSTNGNVVNKMGTKTLSPPAMYVIQEHQRVRDSDKLSVGSNVEPERLYFYRIIARGVGPSGSAEVLLQSTYTRLF